MLLGVMFTNLATLGDHGGPQFQFVCMFTEVSSVNIDGLSQLLRTFGTLLYYILISFLQCEAPQL